MGSLGLGTETRGVVVVVVVVRGCGGRWEQVVCTGKVAKVHLFPARVDNHRSIASGGGKVACTPLPPTTPSS